MLLDDAVVVMDGDLQDVPEVIPQFVEKIPTRLRRSVRETGEKERAVAAAVLLLRVLPVDG